MSGTALDEFCGSTFWDIDVTWNTSEPDFTTCFQKTVLVWTPSVFLALLSPLHLFVKGSREGSAKSPWNCVSSTKLILTILLTIISATEMFCEVYWLSRIEVFPVDYISPLIRLLTFALVMRLHFLERTGSVMASTTLFFYWSILCIADFFIYRSALINLKHQDFSQEKGEFYFVITMIRFPIEVAQFVLSCYRDTDLKIKEREKECPEPRASFLSRLLFWWFNGLILLGWKKSLTRDDLWKLNPDDTTYSIVSKVNKYWNKGSQHSSDTMLSVQTGKENRKQFNILGPLCKAFGSYFLVGSACKVVYDLLQFASPILLRYLIDFVSSDEPVWKGVFYSVLMFVSATVQSLLLGVYFQRMFVVGMRTRTAVVSAIYRKSLVLSNDARRQSTLGEIVNLMSVDAQKMMDILTYANMLWSAPLQIILSMVLLWQILGPSVLAGVGVMVLLIPLNAVIAGVSRKLQMKQMKNKDSRVKLMNEVLNGIKVLKLYAWEKPFQKRVNDIRDVELKQTKHISYLISVTAFVWQCSTVLVSLATFATYVMIDSTNVLDATKAFVSLSLFNVMRMPLTILPDVITTMIMVSVSVKRINKFMNCEELQQYVSSDNLSEDEIIHIKDGDFSWSRESPSVIQNISLSVAKGTLLAVVGQVGAGKSSLLSAILGDMECIKGEVALKGSIAYVSQQAWIQNATLRDNVLFSKQLRKEKYQNVLEACALNPDIKMLPGGDMTEIGEKGINISGGQKQRVSLARAVYNDADIYLLDDPLSAVDAHVGKHLFEKVIGPTGLLRKKTRILVTHGVTYLPQMDKIVVLKDGAISEMGSYSELVEKNGAFAEFLQQYLAEDNEEENLSPLPEGSERSERDQISRQSSRVQSLNDEDSLRRRRRTSSASDGQTKSAEGTKLTQEEIAETGEVKMGVYYQYFKSVGFCMVLLTSMAYLANQAFSVSTNIWLGEWSVDKPMGDAAKDLKQRNYRLLVYGLLGAGQGVTSVIAAFALAFGSITASTILHRNLLLNILRSPTSFFDTTPLGRIVNRFGKDVDNVDFTIPLTMRGWLSCLLQVLASFVVISMQTPIFLVVILPVAVLYYFIQKFYVATSRQLKRLESITRSPIYSHFSESLSGVTTIRAYGAQKRFIQLSDLNVDINQICYYPSIIANRWLAIRLEFCGSIIVLAAALFAALGRDTLDPGTVGLSVTYALSVTAVLNWLVRMTSELETNIVAVERIMEYTNTPTEAPWEVPDMKPPESWPEKGGVMLNKISIRYRPELPLVLKCLSGDIHPGEKIGIVGRTGAGKSSFTMALFRIIELSQGHIDIDKRNVLKMGLHDLRSKLTIIPQDAVLFSGTLRLNLDPLNIYSDDQLWKALEHSHLKVFVTSLSSGLEHEIAEGGENLSVGQRQLVCLARALLRKSQILVLDEATASVDLETDDLIQETIRKEFVSCTVLTIAHRLNTVIDYTRIMVLDQGQLVEFESPNVLLSNQNSLFYKMARDAGLV